MFDLSPQTHPNHWITSLQHSTSLKLYLRDHIIFIQVKTQKFMKMKKRSKKKNKVDMISKQITSVNLVTYQEGLNLRSYKL